MFRSHILVCGGTGCTSGNSMKIYDALVARIQKEGLENEVHVTKTGCFGLCALGPIMIVYPEGAFYSQVKLEDVDEIIDEHIIKGRIVKEKKTHIGNPDEAGKTEIRQVTSNKLIFNVLTPTGYHSLG